VIFDKDGTLIDAHATWAPLLREAVARYAGEPEETDTTESYTEEETRSEYTEAMLIYEVLGMDARSMKFGERSAFMTDSNEVCRRRLGERGVDALAFYRVMDAVCDEMLLSHIVPLFDLNALFDGLRSRGLKVGILTADDACNVQRLMDGQNLTADALGCGDDGRGWKPSGDPLIAIAADLGLETSELIMVGDSTHDVDAGIAAGTATVGVLTGVGSKASLGHADFVVASAEDTCDVVEQLISTTRAPP
jgi:phosphoglycolate phosphatase